MVKRLGIEIDIDLKKDFQKRLKQLGKISMREATEALWFYLIRLTDEEVSFLVRKYRTHKVLHDLRESTEALWLATHRISLQTSAKRRKKHERTDRRNPAG